MHNGLFVKCLFFTPGGYRLIGGPTPRLSEVRNLSHFFPTEGGWASLSLLETHGCPTRRCPHRRQWMWSDTWWRNWPTESVHSVGANGGLAWLWEITRIFYVFMDSPPPTPQWAAHPSPEKPVSLAHLWAKLLWNADVRWGTGVLS